MTKKTAGRPRDEQLTASVIRAATMLTDDIGYEAVTLAMIAEAANVSRQALYRRWPTKAAVMIDAYEARASRIPIPNQGNAQQRLTQYLKNIIDTLNAYPRNMRMMLWDALAQEKSREHLDKSFISNRNRVISEIINSGKATGEFSSDTNTEILVTALHGALWFNILQDKALDHQFAEDLVRQLK